MCVRTCVCVQGCVRHAVDMCVYVHVCVYARDAHTDKGIEHKRERRMKTGFCGEKEI